MSHIQINIEATEEKQEILISELLEFGAIGFEQKDNSLLAYFNEADFKKGDIISFLKEYAFHITSIAAQNWNTVWESNFQPVVIDDFCCVRTDFHKEIKNVKFEIIITPKMSFGTGHHATTYMMIQQMQKISFTNKRIFDFGTGTGILSILAEKLGAASVLAIDNDEWSIKNAEENFTRNNITSITLHQSSNIPVGPFNIILANINKNVLIQYATHLIKILAINGMLLISGLLKEDEKEIVEAFSFLHLQEKQQKENWLSFLFIKQV